MPGRLAAEHVRVELIIAGGDDVERGDAEYGEAAAWTG